MAKGRVRPLTPTLSPRGEGARGQSQTVVGVKRAPDVIPGERIKPKRDPKIKTSGGGAAWRHCDARNAG